MKKHFLFLFLLLVLPIFVHANESYYESVSVANNLLNSSGTSSTYDFSDKDKYLIYGSGTKYEFSNGVSQRSNMFSNGGLVNEEEFELSKKKGSTYLLTGAPYWTMTGNNNYKKYIGVYKLESEFNYDNMSYDTRVTQFVKPATKVSGTGKFTNPWEFEEGYNVIVRTNDSNLGIFKYNNNETEKVESIVKAGSSFELEMKITRGYKYSGRDDCKFTKPASNSNIYRILNVNRDIICTARFNERVFKFTLNSTRYTKEPVPKVLYYKFNDGWYKEYDSDNDNVSERISKIQIPELDGYKFLGYKYHNETIIDEDGNLHDISPDILDYSTDNQVMNAVWKDITKPSVAITTYRYISDSSVHNEGPKIKNEVVFNDDGELEIDINKWLSYAVTLEIHSSDIGSGLKNITWIWNNNSSDSDTGDSYPNGNANNPYTTSLEVKYPTITGKGFRKCQWKVTDNEGNSTTVTVKVKISNARIDFDANGGTISSSNPIYAAYNSNKYYSGRFNNTEITLPTVSRTGWKFLGWYTSATGGNQVISASGAIQKNVSGWTNSDGKWILTNAENNSGGNKLYAHWDGNSYSATFVINGATNIGSTSLSCKVTSGSSCNISAPSIIRSGFAIDGWGTTASATSGVAVSGNISLSSSGNTYYALTHKDVTITFNKNGNGGSDTTRKCTIRNSATSCDITSPDITPASNFTKIGWSKGTNDHTNTWAVDTKKAVTGNDTYYAQSMKSGKEITVTFYKNGNTSQTPKGGSANTANSLTQKCTIADVYNGATQSSSCSITSPTIAAPTGFNVIGYSGAVDNHTSAWNHNIAREVNANATYYAQSMKPELTYTAKWNKNGHNLSSTTNSTCKIAAVYNGASQGTSCTLNPPTVTVNTGYEFVGFNTSSTSTTNNSSYNKTNNVLTLTSSNNNSTWYVIAKSTAYHISYTLNSAECNDNTSCSSCIKLSSAITGLNIKNKQNIVFDIPASGNWDIEFYCSGTLKADRAGIYVDAHTVGGGGAGGSGGVGWRAGGGGGGYTNTINNVALGDGNHVVTIGAGGTAGTYLKPGGDGGQTSISNLCSSSYNKCYANGGKGGAVCDWNDATGCNTNPEGAKGGNGGSGGGASGYSWAYKDKSGFHWGHIPGGDGGANGNNGKRGKGENQNGSMTTVYYSGTGQGFNTKDFGTGTQRAGGGGGRGGIQASSFSETSHTFTISDYAYSTSGGAGGAGGGGKGATVPTNKNDSGTAAEPGQNHFGGGGGAGGGAYSKGLGKDGGSGVVILRNRRYIHKDNKFYYANGNLIKDSKVYYNKQVFYATSDGSKQTGWKKIDNYYYYFQSNGVAYTGTSTTIDSVKYTFDVYGRCTAGGKCD